MSQVRTRFAPSPTGYLHIGGVRTALFCWLYAKKKQGIFILRIEDTDLERSTEESVSAILDGMQWLNLDYAEGPYYQTQRFDRYKEVIQQLISQNQAYYCYCSKERLDTMRSTQLANKEKPRYDGHCRHQTVDKQDTYVVRFKNPEAGDVIFKDVIRGELRFANQELDDLIIARSDGTPTYNFTVVVDDWDMQITHVIRGDDHINNTPRQINILSALNARIPQYAHVPMILGPDGKRLSKRHGAVSVLQFREQGILPEALLNYLVRLGWSHGDQEIFSLEEMIRYFEIEDINRASAAFNEEKLLWLNQHYMKHSHVEQVAKELTWQMQQQGIDISQGPSLKALIEAQAERTKTLKEMAERSRYFYEEVTPESELLAGIPREINEVLRAFYIQLTTVSSWEKTVLHAIFMQTIEKFGLKMGKVAHPLRIILTGGTISPPIDVTLTLLGREKTLARINKYLNHIDNITLAS